MGKEVVVDAAVIQPRVGKLINENLKSPHLTGPTRAPGAIGLYSRYRKRKRKDDSWKKKDGSELALHPSPRRPPV